MEKIYLIDHQQLTKSAIVTDRQSKYRPVMQKQSIITIWIQLNFFSNSLFRNTLSSSKKNKIFLWQKVLCEHTNKSHEQRQSIIFSHAWHLILFMVFYTFKKMYVDKLKNTVTAVLRSHHLKAFWKSCCNVTLVNSI